MTDSDSTPPGTPHSIPYRAPDAASTPDGTSETSRPPRNWFGLSALIAGLVALVGAAIPVLNYLSGFLALAGIVLGIIALFVKDRRRGQGIAGIVISAIALILSIILAVVYTAGFVRWVVDQTDNNRAGGPTGSRDTVELVYEVAGDGDAADIRYTDYDDDQVTDERETDESLPFEETVEIPAFGGPAADEFGISARGGAGTSTISCRITADGVVIDQRTSRGDSPVVACSARGLE